ncbi:TonB family protein [Paludibacter sp. 221]|uniref:TonB family protein n=1 Tax=Paludibacter sp. 221 TaxID=2302939 RepID=UPI0013D28584|nr:TonB family protein [Paludibacter sp. 221]NDV47509.1 TonB family protein [Paludibacter sp. 221]
MKITKKHPPLRWLLIFSILFTGISGALAQDTEQEDYLIMEKIEKMPQFPGGQQELFQYLNKTMKYPANAQMKRTEGRVLVSFIVNKEGEITYPRIACGVSSDLDKEALRVIMLMPNWEPGIQKGKKVSVKYTLPINFSLSSGKSKSYVSKLPQYPDGEKKMMRYLREELQYPPNAPKGDKTRIAFVEFVINKKGEIKKPKILVSTHVPPLDEEALRLIKNMPNWTPGEVDKKPAAIRNVLPVVF